MDRAAVKLTPNGLAEKGPSLRVNAPGRCLAHAPFSQPIVNGYTKTRPEPTLQRVLVSAVRCAGLDADPAGVEAGSGSWPANSVILLPWGIMDLNRLTTDSQRFPVITRCTYLNHAAIAPWPRDVAQAVQAFVTDNIEHGPLHYPAWLAVERRLRTRLAQLIGAASANDIALVKNTSDGLNMVANGLDWQPGDAVVFPAGEFSSNALPWRALARLGVEIREVDFERDRCEAELIHAIDRRVRLVAVSSVRYDCGTRLDLERLAKACRTHDAMLCVDAIQQLGCVDLKVANLPIDFLVAGGHKWLLAPEGLGLFWSHPEARARLRPSQHGWRMWENPFDFDARRDAPSASARRFEPGTLNMTGIHALDAAAGLLLEFGMSAIETAVLARTRWLIEVLADSGRFEVITPGSADRHAGIVSAVPIGQAAATVLKKLARDGIYAAQRGRAIRLSPHFYTPEDQIEQAVLAMNKAAAA